MTNDWKPVLDRLDTLLERLDRILPAAEPAPDWKSATAFRWRKGPRGGYLQPVRHRAAATCSRCATRTRSASRT